MGEHGQKLCWVSAEGLVGKVEIGCLQRHCQGQRLEPGRVLLA